MNQAFEPGVGHFDWGRTIVPPQGMDNLPLGGGQLSLPRGGTFCHQKREPYVPHQFFSSDPGAGHLPTLFVLV